MAIINIEKEIPFTTLHSGNKRYKGGTVLAEGDMLAIINNPTPFFIKAELVINGKSITKKTLPPIGTDVFKLTEYTDIEFIQVMFYKHNSTDNLNPLDQYTFNISPSHISDFIIQY